MELKGVGGVSVADLGLEVCRKVDNVDCFEWAFLSAETTTDTESFRNKRYLRRNMSWLQVFVQNRNTLSDGATSIQSLPGMGVSWIGIR